jgi:hypothetical protein
VVGEGVIFQIEHNCYLTIAKLFDAKVKLSSVFQNHKKGGSYLPPFPKATEMGFSFGICG